MRDHAAVVQQILVAEHHPLGRAGRTGRVLQEGQHVGADARIFPGVFHPLGKRVDAQPMHLLQQRRFHQQRLHAFVNAFQRQGHGRFGIGGNGLDAIQLAIHAGRISRHGNHAGIQAAKERDRRSPIRRETAAGPARLATLVRPSQAAMARDRRSSSEKLSSSSSSSPSTRKRYAGSDACCTARERRSSTRVGAP